MNKIKQPYGVQAYPKTKRFYKKWWFLALSAVFAVLLFCFAVVYASVGGISGFNAIFQGGLGVGDDIFDTSQYEDKQNYVELYKGRKYVLCLGSDARNSDKGEMTRADSIILACFNTDKQQLALFSIPRDTYVYIPGHGYDKINATTVYGGPKLCMQTVSDLVGVEVDDYLLVDYGGFEAIVDALGGVTIDVEQNMYHYDPEDGGIYTIDLKAGVQHLDGNKALQYVRYRSYDLGDIARTTTQQKFLEALANELFSSGTILKLPDLISGISRNFETSLSFKEMYQLASTGASMDSLNMVSQTLPGTFWDVDGISYWKVNQNTASVALMDAFEEGKTSEIIQGTGITSNNINNYDSKTGSVSNPIAEDNSDYSYGSELNYDYSWNDTETGVNSDNGLHSTTNSNHSGTNSNNSAHSSNNSSVYNLEETPGHNGSEDPINTDESPSHSGNPSLTNPESSTTNHNESSAGSKTESSSNNKTDSSANNEDSKVSNNDNLNSGQVVIPDGESNNGGASEEVPNTGGIVVPQ